jgi:histidine triad (HIT) family protein
MVPNGDLLYRRSPLPWWMKSRFLGVRRTVPWRVPLDPSCPFCAIIAGTAPAEVVLRDDVALAFLDRTPLFPGHVLVVPTDHVVTLPDLVAVGPFFERVQRVAAAVPPALGAQGSFVANNNVVSQSVAHLHVHVVPRTKGDGLRGFFWPRTKYAAGQAADVAERLREVLSTPR